MLNPRRKSKTSLKLIHAVDNDCYNRFDEKRFFNYLDQDGIDPIFVVCPDVVGCHSRTLALWHYYHHKIKQFGFPVAFVAQNGCTPADIPKDADWIFVGGLDPWKIENIHRFIGNKPVHVGRVNMVGRLQYCNDIGVDSIDGTGIYWELLKKSIHGNKILEILSGDIKQCSLF